MGILESRAFNILSLLGFAFTIWASWYKSNSLIVFLAISGWIYALACATYAHGCITEATKRISDLEDRVGAQADEIVDKSAHIADQLRLTEKIVDVTGRIQAEAADRRQDQPTPMARKPRAKD